MVEQRYHFGTVDVVTGGGVHSIAYQYTTSAGAHYAPVIRSFNADEVRRLASGVELNFEVDGTPGWRVDLQIAGANRNVQLTETDLGQYRDSYTIGNQVASGALRQSLVAGVGRQDAQRGGDLAGGQPRIERFDVQGSDDLSSGNDFSFMLHGTPGAKVDMMIACTRSVFVLPEVRPGDYEGAYIIRRGDRIALNKVVTANMRLNGRVATQTL